MVHYVLRIVQLENIKMNFNVQDVMMVVLHVIILLNV